jgi:putative endonuclease
VAKKIDKKYLFLNKKVMKSSFVYILSCADGTYYTGVTSNLEKRLLEHKSSKNIGSYVSKRLPIKLVYYEHFMDINQAIEWEKRIKKWSKAKKEALIQDRWDDLKKSAKCSNETSHKNYRS